MDDEMAEISRRLQYLHLNRDSIKKTRYGDVNERSQYYEHLDDNDWSHYLHGGEYFYGRRSSDGIIPSTTSAENDGLDERTEKTVAKSEDKKLSEVSTDEQPGPWHFRLGAILGSGFFGAVYEGVGYVGTARTVLLAAREVAILAQDEQELIRDVERLSRLKHDNIVNYLGIEKANGKLYIFMERVSKGSLQKFCKTVKLPSSAISIYTRQILEGLKYLHRRRVLHGNIKCANIVVQNGVCKLADFGISRLYYNSGRKMAAFRSIAPWIAPEVIDPQKSSGLPADIWSLGCSIIEMATGSSPYGEIGLRELSRRIRLGKAPPIPDSLPETAKDFVERCLRIDPLTRPAAAELLQHPFLQPLGDNLPTSSHVVSPVEKDCVQAIKREGHADVSVDQREGGLELLGTPKFEESDSETCEPGADSSAHIKEIVDSADFKGKRIMEEPGGHLRNISEEQSKVVQDFIAEVKKGEEDGFFVSTKWLYDLQEQEKVALMSVVRSSGYSEVYDTGTTILYERAYHDIVSPTREASRTYDRNDATLHSTDQAAVSRMSSDVLETKQEGPNICVENLAHDALPSDSLTGVFSDSSSLRTERFEEEILSSAVDTAMKTNYDSVVGILENEKKQSGNLVERHSIIMDAFMAALKEQSLWSYYVSTQWLSNLEDHEKEMVNSICVETGYTKTYETSSMTCYERNEGRAQSMSSCNDASSTEEETDFEILPNAIEGFNRDGTMINSLDRKRERLKPDSTQNCIGQLLEVTCRSSLESSTSTQPLTSSQNPHQRFMRQPCGDSFVTLPRQGKGYTLPTKVDKLIAMTSVDFRGPNVYVEVPISLKVNLETIVSCCLRNDDNPKKIHVKFLKIGGQIKTVTTMEQNLNALVLKSIRTNVVAFMDRRDEHDGYESIDLNVEEEYSQSPHRRVLETFQVLVKGNQTKRLDRVWLALSGINPENDELGSITVELQCHVLRTCKAQLQGKINGAHVLLFKDRHPLILEGDICTSLSHKSFLQLDIRYQLELSYIQPYKAFPEEARPYLYGKRKTEVVEFDCVLEYQARNLCLC